MEANKYPPNLESFILLEKLKEQEAELKKTAKKISASIPKIIDLDSYDYMEPIPLSLDAHPSQSTASSDANGQNSNNSGSEQSPKNKLDKQHYDANKTKEKAEFVKYFFEKMKNKSKSGNQTYASKVQEL